MSALFDASLVPALLWLGAKASVVLAAAGLLDVLTRRRTSAAARHLLWSVAAVCLLLLPVAGGVMPRWALPIPGPAPAATPAADTARMPERSGATAPAATTSIALASTPGPTAAPAPGPTPMSWWNAAAGLYFLGLTSVLLSLALQHWRIHRLARRTAVVDDDGWQRLLVEDARRMGVGRPVRLLRARETTVPMTIGVSRPSIVLPPIADTWSEDRRRAVLRHELAHVARYDCLTQTLALAACAIYWPHPGVWWLARRLRVERELACDDRVLAAGTAASDYAGHLLDIAYTIDGRRAPALAVAMARPCQLESRLLAALDAARNRRTPGRGARLGLVAGAVVGLLVLAGATPTLATPVSPVQSLESALVTDTPPTVVVPETETGQAAAAPQRREPHLQEVTWPPLVAARRLADSVVALVAQAVQAPGPGTWELRPTSTPGTVHLRLAEAQSSHGRNVRVASLEGLTELQLSGSGGPIQFRLTRDAGAFQFEGVLRSGVGAGTFSFTPNPAFPAELVKRGFTKPTEREQYELARHDIGYVYLDELNRLGYAKPDMALLVKAGQHGVDVAYLREMGALGYALGSLPPLITLRDHGVTPDYVRAMAQEGYAKLPAETIRTARDHGVTPEYVKRMREAGYGSVPLDALIEARDHGVTPEYIQALAEAGYRGVPLAEVIRVRDHGVTPEYLRGMEALGYARTPLDRLVKARDHGVTPDYAKALQAIGYDTLSLDDLVMLRDHGLTADRIRSANARAGAKLPIDQLRSLAARGGLR